MKEEVILVKPTDNEIPLGYDLCISEFDFNIEKVKEKALVLNGFDEVALGLFEEDFQNSVYVFVKS
ncbi:hypothetical protein CMI37_32860 [Candidatus Pacearchaeota archaeon]|nr:hypothetical protein [Candidatus Pacearchaeota archaeon]|tara:strand:+ start:5051 stop:5248 length:198 start_codon:yes stop_codon:yes gene_type:complete